MKSSRDGTYTNSANGARRAVRAVPEATPAGEIGPRSGARRDALPTVSVILPFLNAERTIEAQLEALRAQTYPGWYEVLACDNGSVDGSRRLVQDRMPSWPELRLVDASQARGVSHARNRGLAEARGDIVLGCDADDVAAADWVETMAKALVQRGLDVVGGRFDEHSLNPPSVRSWFTMKPTTQLQVSYGLAPVATGANYGAWRAVARDIGGWDVAYVCGGDDIAFSWRAQELGYRIGCVPEAIVHRRRRETLAALARQSFQQGRQVPRLLADFRDSPLGTPRLRQGPVRSAFRLLVAAPRALIDARARGGWVRAASTGLGVVVGRLERIGGRRTPGRGRGRSDR